MTLARVFRFSGALRALVFAVLLCAPTLAFAQDSAPAPPAGDKPGMPRMEDMMGFMNSMGPMYESMSTAMVTGMLKAMSEPATIERMAAFTRRYYEALIAQGFTKAEALQIVAGVGVPALRMVR